MNMTVIYTKLAHIKDARLSTEHSWHRCHVCGHQHKQVFVYEPGQTIEGKSRFCRVCLHHIWMRWALAIKDENPGFFAADFGAWWDSLEVKE